MINVADIQTSMPSIEMGTQLYFAKYLIWLLPLMIWTSIWKAFGLWKSARNGSKPWFIVIFLLNTVGILEILYIFVFGKNKGKKSK